mmetsp:Transcript_27004/g.27242  ORF Transcript_27004/g.27242 Transcript_27004/m.27242 type:complete len:147 (+) Transcript_27004:156-596(+)
MEIASTSSDQPEGVFHGNCFVKIAQMGVFLDDEWDSVFAIIGPGYIRIYASEEDYANSCTFVYELALSPVHLLSEVVSKNYSKDSQKPITIHSFYVYKSLGGLHIKSIKIGNLNESIICGIRKTVSDFRYTDNNKLVGEFKTPLFH